MRVLGAIGGTGRFASEDVEFKGVLFPSGTIVAASFVAANNDSRVFPDPATFDITKEPSNQPQLTFGSGIHYCLGAWLARAELQEALPILARRLPGSGRRRRDRVEAQHLRDLGPGPHADYVHAMLTAEQLDAYDRDGFLVVEGFAAKEDCAALIDRAVDLMRSTDLAAVRSIFTTKEQERVSDDYFLGSGGTIRYFFEEEAFGPGGELRQPVEESINKIGHALHDLDPTFAAFSRQPALAEVAADVGLDRSAAPPVDVHLQGPAHRRRGRVPPGRHVPLHGPAHRDRASGSPSKTPPSTTAACGRRRAVTALRCASVFKRRADGVGTEFEVRDDTPLPDPFEPGALVPLEAPAGNTRRAERHAPALERRQPLGPQPPRLLAARASMPTPTTRRGTGCSATPAPRLLTRIHVL